jgi:GTP-binding protein
VAEFVDESNLHVKAGDGGAGAVAFRREAHVARGGPDGGDGGSGGSVWLVADHNVASLLAFRDHPFRRATDGTHGSGNGRHGRTGDDIEVTVPEGTGVGCGAKWDECRAIDRRARRERRQERTPIGWRVRS